MASKRPRAEAAEEAYKTALAGVTSEIATAKTPADALTDESSAADVTAANNKVSAAQTALDDAGLNDADTTTQQAAITALTMTISDGDAGRTAHRTMVAEAKVESDSDAAKTKTTAIKAEADQAEADDAGLGGGTASALTAGEAGSYELDIKRDADGTTITVTVNGANDDADVTFMKAADLNGAAGHKGQMQTRSMDDDGNVVTEVALVYTDIEAPTPTAFGTIHTLNVRVDGEDDDDTDADPNDARNVVAGDLTHVKASAFTAPAGTVGTTVLRFQHEVEDTADTADTDEDVSMAAAEIMGTFEGAMGTYKCNAGSECTVTVDTKGVVSSVSNDNDWIFIPADGETVDVDDVDYLRYGAWLQRTADKDGATTYNEVETFAGSEVDTSDVGDVEGSAKYEGGAAGVYVKNVFTSEGEIDTATSGHFTADAELNATFGQVEDADNVGTIADNLLNTLTGTINNFKLSGGEENEWSVSLQGAGATGNIVTNEGTASGMAQGGGDAGKWNSTFHGLTSSMTVDGATTNFAPDSVVGEFDANFSNGSAAGAFGARKQ